MYNVMDDNHFLEEAAALSLAEAKTILDAPPPLWGEVQSLRPNNLTVAFRSLNRNPLEHWK